MANPPVPPPLVPLLPSLAGLLNRAPTNLVALNDPVGIPTNQEIVRENRRILEIQHTQQFEHGNLDDDAYGNAIVRHHRILSVRCDNDIGVGNAAVLAQLANLRHGVQVLDTRMNLLEARRLVDRARTINNRIDQGLQGVEFVAIVKHTLDHPNFNPPGSIPGVVFQNAYIIGDEPPIGLVPQSYAQFNDMVNLPLPDLRRILRGIYWFYNDPLLEVGANAGRANCLIVVDGVKRFLNDL